MRKVLECRSVVPGCNFVAHADNETDLLAKAAEHARNVHGVEHLSPDLKAKIQAAIREESEHPQHS